MRNTETLELILSDEETALKSTLERVLKEPSNRRIIFRVSGSRDRVSIIERLRDFLATNISRTVIVYAE